MAGAYFHASAQGCCTLDNDNDDAFQPSRNSVKICNEISRIKQCDDKNMQLSVGLSRGNLQLEGII